MKKHISLTALILVLWGTGYAQGAQEPLRLSLQESINFALQNRASLKATRNEEKIAKARVGEIRAAGLPQINAAVDAGDNFIQQQSFLPAEFFRTQTTLTHRRRVRLCRLPLLLPTPAMPPLRVANSSLMAPI
ncbi:hypothetical protein GCM10028895_31010 [Pontibacter rugosus]